MPVTMYGLYARNPAEGDLVWFTTDKSLEPGAYVLEEHHSPSPELYVAESIPALILRVGPIIDQMQDHAQGSLSTNDIPADAEQQIAEEMTEGLLERLTQTSNIWVTNPGWVDKLRRV